MPGGADAAAFQECVRSLRTEVGRVFIGQPGLVEQLIWCVFCGGHAPHSPLEWVSRQDMDKAVEVIVELCRLTHDN